MVCQSIDHPHPLPLMHCHVSCSSSSSSSDSGIVIRRAHSLLEGFDVLINTFTITFHLFKDDDDGDDDDDSFVWGFYITFL